MTGWQDIEAEVLRRIHARDWPPGSAIPHEAALAVEFGVARATVNRALQSLAEAGWLDRRRKAGTRVALHPVRKATLVIPIIRAEIEATERVYGYRLLDRRMAVPQDHVARHLRLVTPLLHVAALHMADAAPYAHEDRWINPGAVPQVMAVDLSVDNANEWLVANAPFTHGDYAIAAVTASAQMALQVGADHGTALVTVERSTWNGEVPITWVRLTFAPGHRIRAAF